MTDVTGWSSLKKKSQTNEKGSSQQQSPLIISELRFEAWRSSSRVIILCKIQSPVTIFWQTLTG